MVLVPCSGAPAPGGMRQSMNTVPPLWMRSSVKGGITSAVPELSAGMVGVCHAVMALGWVSGSGPSMMAVLLPWASRPVTTRRIMGRIMRGFPPWPGLAGHRTRRGRAGWALRLGGGAWGGSCGWWGFGLGGRFLQGGYPPAPHYWFGGGSNGGASSKRDRLRRLCSRPFHHFQISQPIKPATGAHM